MVAEATGRMIDSLVGAMWITFAANAILGGALLQFGIVPRTVDRKSVV